MVVIDIGVMNFSMDSACLSTCKVAVDIDVVLYYNGVTLSVTLLISSGSGYPVAHLILSYQIIYYLIGYSVPGELLLSDGLLSNWLLLGSCSIGHYWATCYPNAPSGNGMS